MLKETKNIQYLSTAELAKLLGVSRIAVFKKIQSGKIKGFKIGRNYVIPVEEFMSAVGTFISQDKKDEIKKIVKKAVTEYGEALKLLGRE